MSLLCRAGKAEGVRLQGTMAGVFVCLVFCVLVHLGGRVVEGKDDGFPVDSLGDFEPAQS